MRVPTSVVIFAAALVAAPTWAYEGEVHREQVDAGVAQPVLTKAPALLEFVEASYPPDAAALGLTASVRMRITIGADGRVENAEIAEPAGHGFDEAALEAVRRFRFSPAEIDGAPAAVQIEYVYHFVLATRPPDAGTTTAVPVSKPATLAGEIVARGSRTRISGASIRCGDDADAPEAVTDGAGRFSLEVPSGSCDVRVVANGYLLFHTREELPPGSHLDVIYHLVPTAIGYETVVRGEREKKEVVRRTLERQELERVPGTFGDPVRVVENLPGVARAPFVGGRLIVRGATPDETATLLDGVEIPLLYHFLGGPSVVNPEFLDRVDFFPGGFGARYGRAIGGVVEVATRKGASDTWHGSLEVDLLHSGVFLEAPVAPGTSAAVAARRSYVDALIPFVLPADPAGGSLLVLPRYWDYQVRVDVGAGRASSRPDRSSSFYVMAFGSDDSLRVVATGGARNRDVTLNVHTLFHRVKGDWTLRLGRLTSNFTPYAGYDQGGFSFGSTTLRGDIYSLGAREDLALEISPHLLARAGIDVQFEHLIGAAQVPVIGGAQYVAFPGAEPRAELQEIDRTFNAFDGALYGELDVKLGRLTVTPGVRASASRLYGQARRTAEPRLWVRFAPTTEYAVKGSIGLYTQPPEVTDLEPPPFGVPSLVHEKAFQTSLGVERRLTQVVSIDLTGYYNRRFDLVVTPGEIVVNPDGSVTRNPYANAGLGRAWGLEVLLRHEVTRQFFGWVAYTLNRSEARRAGEDPYVLTPFDQTHILTAVGSYRLPGGFEVGARFRYVTGSPTTPLQHRYDIYNADSNRFAPTRGAPYSARERPFHQLDVRVDKSFLFESWTLGAYLDVQNVYNASNVEARFSDYRFRTEYEVPGIPILPVLGVKGSF
ncbi:MAG TPA: TonB family protein [Myxococcaceae bacterium]|nr:TonB family protein [Myxococcaceae bacterium]